ncbi:MAG: translational GTPase TypA [Candidatus Latescibacter sp.]|nr:translational GTPase TypA [Candidatus Latescibacter sp.]
MLKTRENIRNIAIIAHVDHGKTTLVDALLRQSGAYRSHEHVVERAMDSMDLERERGITIMSKNTAVAFRDIIINIVDTPGHADFGGEVQRVLKMVDGCLLLVDAAEGPLPQTRYVLSNALLNGLSPIVVINKIDRPDSRISEVLDEVFELFMDLDATDEQCDFPVVFTVAREGTATLDPAVPGSDLLPLFELITSQVPAPVYDDSIPLQLQITTLDYSDYLGRIGIGRIANGNIAVGQTILMGSGEEGEEYTRAKVTQLFGFSGLHRAPVGSAGPGEIVAIAGIEGIKLGDTLTDPEDPRPLPPLRIDEPTLEMVFTINTSPLAGQDGRYLTSREIRDRLFKEIQGNPSLHVEETDNAKEFKVIGRGELQLGVLIETMRREGYELSVGKPTVRMRRDKGALIEPWEHLVIDCPEAHIGVITQTMGSRKGRMTRMVNHSSGWVRIEYDIPMRGLIGLRSFLMVETRGTAVLNSLFLDWQPHAGEIPHRTSGVIVADRRGRATAYALENLQERGQLFCGPGEDVYSGRIVGRNSRSEDMWANPTKEKKKDNMRAVGKDDNYQLYPPKIISLEEALEYIADDELVEITPRVIRIRKKHLDPNSARQAAKKGAGE